MSVRRNSRSWLECAMPRDFRMYRPRLRSPSISMSRSTSHVSIREERPISVRSWLAPARRKIGEYGRDLLHLEEVDQPDEHRLDLVLVPHADEVADRVDDTRCG